MRTKVELHPDVVKYVSGLPDPDHTDFVSSLEWVREDPIRRSTAHVERQIRGHMLRRFEFGKGVARIAIFVYDAAVDRMRILHCRFTRPRRLRSEEN